MTASLNEKFVAYFALISGLAISAVAIFYSVSGLIAIYPMALIPIIVMGVSIEIGKLSMTLWLKQNWDCPWIYKLTMIPAVLILMLITSGGVFGFLSKAHSDQSLISGDAVSKVQLIDDRINTVKDNIATQRENITAARTALGQLDSQVNARLDRGSDEASAERSVQIRRNQRTERAALNREITEAQSEIEKLNAQLAALNQEKAPLAGELRKVEAEVGPVKYIAALIYGDNPDTNLLERAVRWVTLMIVIVLDPVAILLLLASQYSFQRIRDRNNPTALTVIEDNPPTEKSVNETTATISNTESIIVAEPIASIDEISTATIKLDEPIIVTSVTAVANTSDVMVQEVETISTTVLDTIDITVEDSLEIITTGPLEETVVTEDVSTSTIEIPQTADSEIPVDFASTEYIQNEEQRDSSLWSNTSLNSITQAEYLDKVRRLKGVE